MEAHFWIGYLKVLKTAVLNEYESYVFGYKIYYYYYYYYYNNKLWLTTKKSNIKKWNKLGLRNLKPINVTLKI